MVIPATDLTINSVIVFERVKVMIAMAPIHLCFGGDSPLGYVKNNVLLFSATTALSSKTIQLNRTITWGDFFPIYFQIYGFENLIP